MIGGQDSAGGTCSVYRRSVDRPIAMHPKNRKALAARVVKAAEASLAQKKYVSAIDVLVGIGWLDPGSVERWRRGQIDYLERVVHSNLRRISEAMKQFRSWAARRGLHSSETHYRRRSKVLRFSRSGDPAIERHYRTHWVSRELSDKKAERLPDKGRSPDSAAVVVPLASAGCLDVRNAAMSGDGVP
jgi:hypothetical protein